MTRTPVCKVIQTFDLPPDALWPIIGPGWAAIKLWIPGIESCSLSPPNVCVGAVRDIRAKEGWHLKEKMEVYDPEGYFTSYRVLEPNGTPTKGLFGNCKLEPEGKSGTKITWWADAEEADENGIAVAGPYLTNLFETSLAALRTLMTA